MADWSKVLTLTAGCLSQLPGFDFCSGQVRKFPVTWGLAMVFLGTCACFLHHLELASQDVAASWQKR